MKKDYLKDEGNALRIQKHQLNNTENKISEIDDILSGLQKEQTSNDEALDKMLLEMSTLLENNSVVVSNDTSTKELLNIESELSVDTEKLNISTVSEIDYIKLNDNTSWDDYINSIEDYGFKHNLNLEEDPFKHLMTKSQQVELQKQIKEEFTLKNANCNKYDYMIAGTCGVIGGLIDILFGGMPTDSKLGNIADEQANKITEKFAEFVGWDKDKAVEKGSNTTASAIGYLEGKFKVNYDQTSIDGVGSKGKKLTAKNHHLKSLGHSPDLIGLFFSILNQFTNTSSFIIKGKLITIDTETSELQGDNFIAKIFCGFANWFGHIMSDWAGSSGTVKKDGRGMGVPIPFYSLFQLMDFGEFNYTPNKNNKKTVKLTFAQMTSTIFENGYDSRHSMAMAVPVLTTELLIRFMYTMKSHFYHEREWKDSIPSGNIPEVRRMLLVGHGTLCLIDGVDAGIRSGGDMVTFLLRTNLLAWVRFGQLGLKEVNAWWNKGHIDADAIDEYLDREYRKMLKRI